MNLKLFSDQRIQIDAFGDDIPAKHRRTSISNRQIRAQSSVHFDRKEGDLAFVVRFEIEKAVAFQPATRGALNGFHFKHGMLAWRLFMMSEVVVTRTNVEITNGHWHTPKLASEQFTAQTETMRHSAVLLAGGKSTRMGRDKACLEVDGKPLWRRQLDVLKSTQPAELYVSGPIEGPYAGSDCVIVPDRVGNCGPLAGLSAALEACDVDWLLALAIDMPRMSPEYLLSLGGQVDRSGRGQIPVHADGRMEPLAAIYPRAAYELSRELLKAGERRLSAFVEALEYAKLGQRILISADDERLFANWNRPEDLSA